MMAKGKGKTPEMNVVAREFSLDSATKEYRIHWLEHIYGITNVEADALSRQFSPFPKPFPENLRSAVQREVDFGEDFWKVRDLRVRATNRPLEES